MAEIRNIIKLERDEEVGTYGDSLEDFNVKYLGERIYRVRDILETIQYLNEGILNNKLTEDEIFLNYAKDNEEEMYNKLLENSYDAEKEKFKTLQDFVERYSIDELLDEFMQSDDDYEILCESNNCKFGTVGYSPWSYYVSWKDIGEDFVRDLYEGWNWYNLTLIKDGGDYDSVGWCYITNESELDEYVLGQFGVNANDYYLVDNEYAAYFSKPKIEVE